MRIISCDKVGLAIETSCDETSAAVVDFNYRVLSNVVASQIPFHKEFGGVVPEIASRKHVELLNYIVRRALKESKVNFGNIEFVSATRGPGLIGSLMVGLTAAKGFAFALRKPMVFVDHIESHIWANFLGGKKPELPAVCLVISGGHTNFYRMDKDLKLKLLGATLDDAVGEAFDKVAHVLGLSYPGGPEIEKLAEKSKNPYKFPRPMIDSGDLNVSLSGLKTAVAYFVKKNPDASPEDIAFGFQQAVCDMLIKKLDFALKKYNPQSILIAGGVIANTYLRRKFSQFSDRKKIAMSFPQFEYCTDNAAMVAARAIFRYCAGQRDNFQSEAYSITRTGV